MNENKMTTLKLKNGTIKVNKESLITASTLVLTNAVMTLAAHYSYNDLLLDTFAIFQQGLTTTYINGVLNGTEEYIESRIK